MVYFLVSLIVLAIIALGLLILFLGAMAQYRERSWTKTWQYFSPVFVLVLFLVVTIVGFAPRLLDSLDVFVKNRYEIKTVEVAKLSFPQVLKTTNGESYAYSALEMDFAVGETYILYLTPRTNFIVSAQISEAVK